MKRRNFILSSFVAAPVLASASQLTTNDNTPESFTVKTGEARFGTHTPFRGVNPNDLKISKRDTEGSVAMFEYIGTEKTGPSFHVHLKQDEIFYVAEGEFYSKSESKKAPSKPVTPFFSLEKCPTRGCNFPTEEN